MEKLSDTTWSHSSFPSMPFGTIKSLGYQLHVTGRVYMRWACPYTKVEFLVKNYKVLLDLNKIVEPVGNEK